MNLDKLTIGAWVHIKGEHERDVQITALLGNYVGVADSAVYENLDNVEGITLTPEFLERNGFKKTKYGYNEQFGDVYKWCLIDDCDDTILTLFKISNGFVAHLYEGMTLGFQYVHELQLLLEAMGWKYADDIIV